MLLALAIGLGGASANASDPANGEFENLLAPLQALDGAPTDGSVPRSVGDVAKRIRAQLEADLGSALPVCPEIDPSSGVVVVRDEQDDSGAEPAHPLLQALAQLLDSSSPAQRDAAAFILAEIGPYAKSIVSSRVEGSWERPNWLTHAAARTDCDAWSMLGALQSIPEPLRKQAQERAQHPQWPMLLAAMLLRQTDRIWPDGLIANLHEPHDFGVDAAAAPLSEAMHGALLELEAIASDPAGELRVRLEVLELLSRAQTLGPAADGLRVLMAHAHDPISMAAADALYASDNRYRVEALIVLLERHQQRLLWRDSKPFCQAGIVAPRLVQILTLRLHGPDWGEAKAAAEWFGCVRSSKAPAELLGALEHRSWEVVRAAIGALGDWLASDPVVAQALIRIEKGHWSGLLREQARTLLHGPEGPVQPAPEESDEMVLISIGGSCFHRCLTDHLNAVCSIDGEVADGVYASPLLGSFPVVWQRARRHPPPAGFPLQLEEDGNRPDYGTNTFLPVDDGWLVGLDRWHYDGFVAHVYRDGENQQISRFGENAAFIVDTPHFGRVALGRSLFGLGEGGLLASLQAEGSQWTLRYLSSLPSPPWAWAYAPDGTLLVADRYNAVAVHADLQIEALSCPTVIPETMPEKVLAVAAQAGDSPLPLRMRQAPMDAAIRGPLVERWRQLLAESGGNAEQDDSHQHIVSGYQEALQGLIDALQLAGDTDAALDLMADPWFADGSLLVGQRAALLINSGRANEALDDLLKNDEVEQYISRFLLAAKAVIDGDRELAAERLQRTRSALLLEAKQGNWEPELRYIEILELINGDAAPNAVAIASDTATWPDPLLAYFRDDLSEAALVPSLYRRDGQVDRERLCEALVYIAIQAASQGRRSQAIPYFKAAAELSILDFIEHALALWVLAED